MLFLFPFLLACTFFAIAMSFFWSRTGNAFLDICVHVCAVDVYFRDFLAEVSNTGILGSGLESCFLPRSGLTVS